VVDEVDGLHGLDGIDLARVPLTPEVVAAHDLVVLVTDHADFDLGVLAASNTLVFDTRRRVPSAPNVHVL
jgi:UDP-N-acetyl-D-glucosamine dehydrogenase